MTWVQFLVAHIGSHENDLEFPLILGKPAIMGRTEDREGSWSSELLSALPLALLEPSGLGCEFHL